MRAALVAPTKIIAGACVCDCVCVSVCVCVCVCACVRARMRCMFRIGCIFRLHDMWAALAAPIKIIACVCVYGMHACVHVRAFSSPPLVAATLALTFSHVSAEL